LQKVCEVMNAGLVEITSEAENNFVKAHALARLGTSTSTGGRVEGFGLVFALRPQTPKHIRCGWSHYTEGEGGELSWAYRPEMSSLLLF
jgi:hypothetical protein